MIWLQKISPGEPNFDQLNKVKLEQKIGSSSSSGIDKMNQLHISWQSQTFCLVNT